MMRTRCERTNMERCIAPSPPRFSAGSNSPQRLASTLRRILVAFGESTWSESEWCKGFTPAWAATKFKNRSYYLEYCSLQTMQSTGRKTALCSFPLYCTDLQWGFTVCIPPLSHLLLCAISIFMLIHMKNKCAQQHTCIMINNKCAQSICFHANLQQSLLVGCFSKFSSLLVTQRTELAEKAELFRI